MEMQLTKEITRPSHDSLSMFVGKWWPSWRWKSPKESPHPVMTHYPCLEDNDDLHGSESHQRNHQTQSWLTIHVCRPMMTFMEVKEESPHPVMTHYPCFVGQSDDLFFYLNDAWGNFTLLRALWLWISYTCRVYFFLCYSCATPTLSFEWNKEVLDFTEVYNSPKESPHPVMTHYPCL